ncbi:hypothetical protein EV715DRAFT_268578 [Schizophyllum commune]
MERPPLPSPCCPPSSKPAPLKHPTTTLSPYPTSFDGCPHCPIHPSVRSSDARTSQAVPTQECAISDAIPTREGARPNGPHPHFRAVTYHAPTSTTTRTSTNACADGIAPLATAIFREEYMRVDDIHFAEASAQERGDGLGRAHHAGPYAGSAYLNTTAAALPHPQQGAIKPSPQPALHPSPSRTRLPPPPLVPPPLPLRPPATPPDWPFPISIEEMGWVLTAVVMARRMDQEDEQRQRDDEYDYDQIDLQRDETDTGVARDLERGASSPELSAHGSDIFGSDTMATLDEQEHDEYEDSFDPASSVSSPVASINIEHDDANAWESEVASLHLSDQLDEDFNGSDGSEDQYWQDEVVDDV